MVQMQSNSNRVALNVPWYIFRQIIQPVKRTFPFWGFSCSWTKISIPSTLSVLLDWITADQEMVEDGRDLLGTQILPVCPSRVSYSTLSNLWSQLSKFLCESTCNYTNKFPVWDDTLVTLCRARKGVSTALSSVSPQVFTHETVKFFH